MATRKDVANIGNLDKKVQALLKTYGDQVRDDLEEVTIKVADFGVKEIKANARTYKWGKEYVNGWTKTDTSTRLTTGVVIHHKTMPGLPHLLEHGHITIRNGKRVKDARAFEHIKPVEDKIVELYQREVKSKL